MEGEGGGQREREREGGGKYFNVCKSKLRFEMLLSGVAHAPSVDARSIRWASQQHIKVMTNEPRTGLKWERGGGKKWSMNRIKNECMICKRKSD